MKLEAATDAAQTIARYRAHVSEGMAMLAELMEAHVEVRSEGTRIWDEDGTEYLDCGGYGVFILGHGYPRVVAAVHGMPRDGLVHRPARRAGDPRQHQGDLAGLFGSAYEPKG